MTAVAEQLSLLLLSELVPPDVAVPPDGLPPDVVPPEVLPPEVLPPEVEPSSEEHAVVETANKKQAASEAMCVFFMRPRHSPIARDASKSNDPGRFPESAAILGRWNSKNASKSLG